MWRLRRHQGLGGQLIVPPSQSQPDGTDPCTASALADSCASTIERPPDTPDRVSGQYGERTLLFLALVLILAPGAAYSSTSDGIAALD